MNRQVLFLFLLFSATLSYSHSPFKDSTATVSIDAKDYPGTTLLFYVSSDATPSVSLSPAGSGSITFPLNKSRFVAFGTSDSIFFTLLMDPGYDLRITLDNGISKIEGNGAAANNYLLKAKPLVDSMISATNEYSDRNKKPDEFLDVMQALKNNSTISISNIPAVPA